VGAPEAVQRQGPGFEHSYVEKTPSVFLTGDMHRMIGDYVLNISDMREGAAFEDSVGISNMPPDLYELLGRFSFDILPYDIPYRCLVSKGSITLWLPAPPCRPEAWLFRQRAIACPAVIQGQAAGTAAAMAARNNISPKKVNIRQLQDNLREQGAHISVKEASEEILAPYRAIRELSMLAPKPEIYNELGKY